MIFYDSNEVRTINRDIKDREFYGQSCEEVGKTFV